MVAPHSQKQFLGVIHRRVALSADYSMPLRYAAVATRTDQHALLSVLAAV